MTGIGRLRPRWRWLSHQNQSRGRTTVKEERSFRRALPHDPPHNASGTVAQGLDVVVHLMHDIVAVAGSVSIARFSIFGVKFVAQALPDGLPIATCRLC